VRRRVGGCLEAYAQCRTCLHPLQHSWSGPARSLASRPLRPRRCAAAPRSPRRGERRSLRAGAAPAESSTGARRPRRRGPPPPPPTRCDRWWRTPCPPRHQARTAPAKTNPATIRGPQLARAAQTRHLVAAAVAAFFGKSRRRCDLAIPSSKTPEGPISAQSKDGNHQRHPQLFTTQPIGSSVLLLAAEPSPHLYRIIHTRSPYGPTRRGSFVRRSPPRCVPRRRKATSETQTSKLARFPSGCGPSSAHGAGPPTWSARTTTTGCRCCCSAWS
jgi:hypothetical protein